MRYILQPLEWQLDSHRNIHISTNGIKEYQVGRMLDGTSGFVATSTDGEFMEYNSCSDELKDMCNKDQEKLVRSVLKDKALETLENLPD